MSDSNGISNNSGPGSAAEPSMEEILASIRRILKEDEAAQAEVEDDVLVLDASMIAAPADISTATEFPAEGEPVAEQDAAPFTEAYEPVNFASEPAFELGMTETEALEPAPEEAEFLPEWPESESAPDAELSAFDAPVLQEDMFEDDAPEDAAQEAAVPEAALQEPPTLPASEDADEPAVEPQHAAAEAADREDKPVVDEIHSPEGLVSEEARNDIANSVGSLVRSISLDRAVSVSRGGLTIEDIVREEIKPVLKAWLDTHLPSLVERIVRAEIGRVIDRSQA
jgi:uncharacterized protein